MYQLIQLGNLVAFYRVPSSSGFIFVVIIREGEEGEEGHLYDYCCSYCSSFIYVIKINSAYVGTRTNGSFNASVSIKCDFFIVKSKFFFLILKRIVFGSNWKNS